VLAALAPHTDGSAWAVLVAAAACAIPAYLLDRGVSGLRALVRAGVVFGVAVGLGFGLGLTGLSPVLFGATAIITLSLLVVRGALLIGVRAIFGPLLPLHDHEAHHHHPHGPASAEERRGAEHTAPGLQ
jgi:hypothetical protein